MPKAIRPASAPPAIGPYSPGLATGRLLFVSGQLPLTSSGQMVEGGVREQTVQVMENLKTIITEAGATMGQVAKTTIFLVDLADFATVNEVYASYFSEPFPARATVEISRLAKDARVEIDAFVVLD